MTLPQSLPNNPDVVRSIENEADLLNRPRSATIGNYAGDVFVASPNGIGEDAQIRGLVWARLPNGYTAEGTSTAGDVIVCVIEGGASITPEYNLPVTVAKHPIMRGLWVIQGIDTQSIIKLNKNPAQYNDKRGIVPLSVYLRNIVNGKEFPNRVSGAYTKQTVVSDALLLTYDNTVRTPYTATATPIDFTSDFPSDTLTQRFALTYFDTVTGTTDYVLADEEAFNTPITIAKVQGLADKLPHQLTTPLSVIKLDGGFGQIDQRHIQVDLRQFINTPTPSGMPLVLSRNWIIPSNYEEIATKKQTISAGYKLTIQANARLVVL